MLMCILWIEGVCILLLFLFSLSLSLFFSFLSFSLGRVMNVHVERTRERNSVVILACPIT